MIVLPTALIGAYQWKDRNTERNECLFYRPKH